MRILYFSMQGHTAAQFVENDAEAERLYEEAAKALANHAGLSSESRPQTYELVVSDGTRETFRLAGMSRIALAIPSLPGWLRDFHVETRRQARLIELESDRLK